MHSTGLLSSPSAVNRHRAIAQFSHQPDFDVRASAGRARSRISIRRFDSFSRLGAGGRQLSNPRFQLAGSQQYRRIKYLLADHLGGRLDSRLGNHLAFSTPVAPRSSTPGLLKSDRTGDSAHNRRRGLPRSSDTGLPGGYPARIFAGGSRPEKHVEHGCQFKSSLAGVRIHECVLRLRIHQRDAGCGVSKELSAPAHNV